MDVLQSPNAIKFTLNVQNVLGWEGKLHLWGALSVTTSNKFRLALFLHPASTGSRPYSTNSTQIFELT